MDIYTHLYNGFAMYLYIVQQKEMHGNNKHQSQDPRQLLGRGKEMGLRRLICKC